MLVSVHHTELGSDCIDYPSIYSQLVWASQHKVEEKYLHWQTRSENFNMCWMILKGEVKLQNKYEEIHAGEGEWIFISSKDARQDIQKGTRLISIRFILEHLGGKPLFQRHTHQVFRTELYPQLEKDAKQLVRKYKPWQQTGSLLLSYRQTPLRELFQIEAAFNMWLATYIGVMEKQGMFRERPFRLDPRVEKALLYIEHHPLHQKFNEQELSRQVGLSVNQLLLLFHKETGTSPFNYYDQRRQEFASRTLMDTTIPIKEVSFELGFGSASHFSSWFSKKEGLSPRAFRKKATEGIFPGI